MNLWKQHCTEISICWRPNAKRYSKCQSDKSCHWKTSQVACMHNLKKKIPENTFPLEETNENSLTIIIENIVWLSHKSLADRCDSCVYLKHVVHKLAWKNICNWSVSTQTCKCIIVVENKFSHTDFHCHMLSVNCWVTVSVLSVYISTTTFWFCTLLYDSYQHLQGFFFALSTARCFYTQT